jgi:hypothetical protein
MFSESCILGLNTLASPLPKREVQHDPSLLAAAVLFGQWAPIRFTLSRSSRAIFYHECNI